MSGAVTGYRVDSQSVDSLELDGEAVILSLATHTYYGLNHTGTEVWELVKDHPGISAHEIAEALAASHGRAASELAGDVGALLEALIAQQLAVACDHSATAAVRVERGGQPYVVPQVEAYGALDTLVLSGE